MSEVREVTTMDELTQLAEKAATEGPFVPVKIRYHNGIYDVPEINGIPSDKIQSITLQMAVDTPPVALITFLADVDFEGEAAVIRIVEDPPEIRLIDVQHTS